MASDALHQDQQPTLRLVPRTADTNASGDIFGGWIISYVDIAGSIVASRRARGRIATVAVNAFQFKKPVFMNDVVSFYAKVIRTGNTSITVDVTVYAERGARADNPGECVKVTEATLTYVAIDDNRQKRSVPRD